MRTTTSKQTTLCRPVNNTSVPGRTLPRLRRYLAYLLAIPVVAWFPTTSAEAQTPLRELLRSTGFKIAYESYVDGNSDIFVMNADGSNPVKLSRLDFGKQNELVRGTAFDVTRLDWWQQKKPELASAQISALAQLAGTTGVTVSLAVAACFMLAGGLVAWLTFGSLKALERKEL